MEKRNTSSGGRSLRKIVLTGPESTGKSALARYLAQHYDTVWIPEFAREYVMGLNRAYTYEDVEIIGRRQIQELTADYPAAKSFLFFDTGLIITRVWFLECYQHCPSFIDQAIQTITIDLYLLCRPDMEWIHDPVRENQGEKRERLFNRYEEELITFGAPYAIVEGKGEERLARAIHEVEKFFDGENCYQKRDDT